MSTYACPYCSGRAVPLHPRYQQVWETKPDDWTDEEWGGVRTHLHDLAERRWLTPEHAQGLADGTLKVPDRYNNEHVAVLVSIPDEVSETPVAWVDKGVAEAVYWSARCGLKVKESCEDGWGGPTLWFDSARDLEEFEAVAGRTTGQIDGPDDYRRFLKHLIRQGKAWPVIIGPGEMPRVVQRLRAGALQESARRTA